MQTASSRACLVLGRAGPSSWSHGWEEAGGRARVRRKVQRHDGHFPLPGDPLGPRRLLTHAHRAQPWPAERKEIFLARDFS